jgi:hypothetical protein
MSHINNEQWAENAWLNFDDAIHYGSYSVCLDIIEDTKQMGFPEVAKNMEKKLEETAISQFIINESMQSICG